VRIDLQRLVRSRRFSGPAAYRSGHFFVADLRPAIADNRPSSAASCRRTLLICVGARRGEIGSLGERPADPPRHSQARGQESLYPVFERRHSLADSALLEVSDGPPAQPQRAGRFN